MENNVNVGGSFVESTDIKQQKTDQIRIESLQENSAKCREILENSNSGIDIKIIKRKLTNNHSDDDESAIDDIDSEKEPDPPPSTKKPRILSKPNTSPRKRLDLANTPPSTSVSSTPTSSPIKHEKTKFIYGNYSRYYGYRMTDNFHDIRLDIFAEHKKDLFEDKEILDIGCNTGFVTMEISKRFNIKSIIGLDIDKSLINRAKNFIQKCRKLSKGTQKNCFPFNINFIHGNYVLRDDVLLEIECAQFDVILCLSVTKWIHLNFGDAGLKQAFRRMFIQLRPGGKLILEPQPWDGYRKRKKLTAEIFKNYTNTKFFPKDFNSYLLGPEVGFSEMYELGVPEHCSKGFKRPIYVFVKNDVNA